MRFQVKFYAKNSIVLNQFGLRISPDVLQIEGYDLSNLEDRYYRLKFDSAEVMEMCGLQDFKYRKFETNYPEDFAPLFNQLGFFWVNGCVPLMERFNNLEAILTHCEEMLRTKKSLGVGSFSDLGYVHCQCLMILKRDWHSTYLL